MQFVAEKNGWTKFVTTQNHHSLLYREEEREMNKFCRDMIATSSYVLKIVKMSEQHLLMICFLVGGHLARPLYAHSSERLERLQHWADDFSNGDQESIRRVQKLAEKKGWKMSQWLLPG